MSAGKVLYILTEEDVAAMARVSSKIQANDETHVYWRGVGYSDAVLEIINRASITTYPDTPAEKRRWAENLL